MTQTLQRVTTEYIEAEDRIRLSGEVTNAAPVVIWLSFRLLQRMLPLVLRSVERQGAAADSPRAEALHGFAQEAAKSELKPQPPVRATSESRDWLALSVDIANTERGIHMTFRGTNGQQATLGLEAKPLRQWLAILHGAYAKAGWPLDVWPRWVRESLPQPGAGPAALH